MNVRYRVMSLCAAGMTTLMMAGCIDTGNPITPAPDDMPQDTRPDTMDEQPDEPDAEPDIDPDADMEPTPCDGACVEALCINGACIECNAEVGCEASPNGEVCKVAVEPAQNACVACLDDTQCTGALGKCDTVNNVCVGCVVDADCPANAPVCGAGNTCGACTVGNNGACADRGEEAKVCAASGGCVECNPDTAMVDCDGNSCVNNQCTDTPLNSVEQCLTCQSDSECAADHKCVELEFDGSVAGNYCLREAASLPQGCVQPYSVEVTKRTVDSATPVVVCGVSQMFTTCEAIIQRVDQDNVACTSNDECGIDGLNDGVCATVGTNRKRCTYRCDGSSQCRATDRCVLADALDIAAMVVSPTTMLCRP